MSTPIDFALTLSIESRLDYVWTVRAALTGVLTDFRVNSSEIFLIQLAVSEIISNVIEHGYQGRPDRKLEMSLQGAAAQLRIDITDDAPRSSGDKLQQLLQELEIEEAGEKWAERGHGLQIVRLAMDSVSVDRKGNRNVVTLIKQISFDEEKEQRSRLGLQLAFFVGAQLRMEDQPEKISKK